VFEASLGYIARLSQKKKERKEKKRKKKKKKKCHSGTRTQAAPGNSLGVRNAGSQVPPQIF
jgi:hypothetical protein